LCWVHEWAKAINSLEWAKIHVKRAAEKTEKRGLKEAAEVSRDIIKTLESKQWVLKNLIEDFGIFREQNALSLQLHMQGKRVKSGKVHEWVEAY